MSRRSVLIILRFALVLVVIAMVLFFTTDVAAPTFIAISLTIGFCTLVYFLGMFRLYKDETHPISKGRLKLSLIIYCGILVAAVGIKILLVALL